jgi:hypothetical protein
MKTILLMTLVPIVIAIGYPLVNEDTGNECSALESRLITILSTQEPDRSSVIFFSALQRSISNGAFARSLVKQRNPDMPPVLTCGLAYWRLVFHPNQAEAMIKELATGGQIGGEATGELMKTIDPRTAPKAEADKAIRALETPVPDAAPKPAAAPAPSYPAGDRRQLDRVIGTQR